VFVFVARESVRSSNPMDDANWKATESNAMGEGNENNNVADCLSLPSNAARENEQQQQEQCGGGDVGGSNTLCGGATSKNENNKAFYNESTGSKQAKMRKIAHEAALANVMTDLDIIDNGYRNSPYVIVDGDGVLFSGAPKPRNEKERLLAVRASGILDIENKDADEHFDLLTSICATALRVPMCLVSIVGKNKQIFRANIGLDATETKRESSFCGWTLLPKEPKVLVVEDAMQDFRFQTNELVLGPPHLRFYAGAPIIVRGVRFGSFCVLDTKPRHDMSGEDLNLLTRLADACAKTIEKTAMQMYFMDAIDDSDRGFMLVSLGSVDKKEEDDDCRDKEKEEEEEERIPDEYGNYIYNREDQENMDEDEEERDATMSIVYANKATKRLLGFSKEKNFTGESLYTLFSEASASGQIKPNPGERSVDEFFEEILNDESEEKNEKSGMMTKRNFAREFSISKEFSVTTPTTSATAKRGDEGKDATKEKEKKNNNKNNKSMVENMTQTSSRHVRVELSRKASTFQRIRKSGAKNSPPSPPTPGSQDIILDNDNEGSEEEDELNASQQLPKNLSAFHVIVVNITDITCEVNERLRSLKSVQEK
jgi:GAF domain-containing protein